MPEAKTKLRTGTSHGGRSSGLEIALYIFLFFAIVGIIGKIYDWFN